MITCSSCQIPLEFRGDIFGLPGYPLCLDCHAAFLNDNDTDYYRNRAFVARIQLDFARFCPHCQDRVLMEVGVADWQVNAKCPGCGYEETHRLFNLVDDEWNWLNE